MLGVRVHDVRVQRRVEDLHAERQQRRAHVDHEPEQVVLRGPAVEQEPERRKDGARQQERDAELGPRRLALAARQRLVDVVHQRPAELGARDGARADGDVMQAGDGDGFTVCGHVEGGEAGQRKVEKAVVDAFQDGLHLDDGVEGQEAEGAGQAVHQILGGRATRLTSLDLCMVAGIASLLAQLLSALAEEKRSVTLVEQEQRGCLEDDLENSGRPKHPSPSRILHDKASNHGADS